MLCSIPWLYSISTPPPPSVASYRTGAWRTARIHWYCPWNTRTTPLWEENGCVEMNAEEASAALFHEVAVLGTFKLSVARKESKIAGKQLMWIRDHKIYVYSRELMWVEGQFRLPLMWILVKDINAVTIMMIHLAHFRYCRFTRGTVLTLLIRRTFRIIRNS